MSRPIQIGDLVMLVRWPHACFGKGRRTIFVVEGISSNVVCPKCRAVFHENCATYYVDAWDGGFRAVPFSWLKRIDPPSQDESVTRDEEVTA